MNEDRSSYLWLHTVGSLALVTCIYQVSVTLLNQQGTTLIFLRLATFGLFGLCLLFGGFNRVWISLVMGIGAIICLFAADLVRWKNGQMSLLDALLPWFLIGPITWFMIRFALRKNKSGAN